MNKDNPALKQTKIEKTGDHTFRQHTADGGYFECTSKEKLSKFSKLKNINHIKSDSTFSGIGEKKKLVCDSCKKEVQKLQGIFDKKFKKILYHCIDCKNK